MMQSRLLVTAAVIVAVALSRESRAENLGTFGPVTISVSHTPTPALPGYSTWC